jgi:hypothetical protein
MRRTKGRNPATRNRRSHAAQNVGFLRSTAEFLQEAAEVTESWVLSSGFWVTNPKCRSPEANSQSAFSPFGICDHLRHLRLKMIDQGAASLRPYADLHFVSIRVFRGPKSWFRVSHSRFQWSHPCPSEVSVVNL